MFPGQEKWKVLPRGRLRSTQREYNEDFIKYACKHHLTRFNRFSVRYCLCIIIVFLKIVIISACFFVMFSVFLKVFFLKIVLISVFLKIVIISLFLKIVMFSFFLKIVIISVFLKIVIINLFLKIVIISACFTLCSVSSLGSSSLRLF